MTNDRRTAPVPSADVQGPHRCIRPLCGESCCQCSHAVPEAVWQEFLAARRLSNPAPDLLHGEGVTGAPCSACGKPFGVGHRCAPAAPEDAGLVDVEAVSWAYRKLLAFGVGSIKAEDAHMLDRLNLMLQEPPK